MNYRKKYSDRFGCIPPGFEIHHLDLNRKNNEYDNLVMLDKSIHKEYHNLINDFKTERSLVDHAMSYNHSSELLLNKIIRMNELKKIIRVEFLKRYKEGN